MTVALIAILVLAAFAAHAFALRTVQPTHDIAPLWNCGPRPRKEPTP